MTDIDLVCKDCNQCIHEADDGVETHMCSLCKKYVAGIASFISSDAVEASGLAVDVLSK